MNGDTAMEERLIELETRLAHQEETIAELSDIAAKQWETIDRLERTIGRLDDRLRAIQEKPLGPGEEPPPPHY